MLICPFGAVFMSLQCPLKGHHTLKGYMLGKSAPNVEVNPAKVKQSSHSGDIRQTHTTGAKAWVLSQTPLLILSLTSIIWSDWDVHTHKHTTLQ